MIIDPNSTNMTTTGKDMNAPPSYDAAVRYTASSGPFISEGTTKAANVGIPVQPYPGPIAGPPPPNSMPTTTVYNYVNPVTQEHIVSLLPPDHPQMICLQQGGHIAHTRFGLLGILAAIFWFPFGIACCLLDRKVTCDRCGMVLDEGLCP